MTSTPIQNKVEELYSLFKFLKIRPLNEWDTFKRQIANPIKSGQTKVAMKRLHVVLKSIMLRRTKDATISEPRIRRDTGCLLISRWKSYPQPSGPNYPSCRLSV